MLPFSRPNSLIIKSPGRINLIGEHTDYNHGFALPAAIDRAVYLSIFRSDRFKIEALDRQETWIPDSYMEIPPDWSVYFKGVLDVLAQRDIEITPFQLEFTSDLPSGAGLSSSSAITCGFLFALNELFELQLELSDMVRISVLAERASGLEGGMMDQITIFNGRKDHALMINCKIWEFEAVSAILPGFQWLVVDTKVKHKLVDTDYNNKSRFCQHLKTKLSQMDSSIQSLSDVSDWRKYVNVLEENEMTVLKYVIEENARVVRMVNALKNQNINQIGEILFEGHLGLKEQYQVTCAELDFLVDFAEKSNIAKGARMMGGGFGGSTIHVIPISEVSDYTYKIKTAYTKTFGFEPDVFKANIERGVHLVKF